MIRIATRESLLALAQTFETASRLREAGLTTKILPRKTSGDVLLSAPLYQISATAGKEDGKAFFTKELEDVLLADEADIAVHSLKDVPHSLPAGLQLAHTWSAEDPSDTIVLMQDIPDAEVARWLSQPGRRIGTSSQRRIAQLSSFCSAEFVPVRGNLVTRLAKLAAGQADALVLATAGLRRLIRFYSAWKKSDPSFTEIIHELTSAEQAKIHADFERLKCLLISEIHCKKIDPAVLLPAISQGVLGLESRKHVSREWSPLLGEVVSRDLDRKIMERLESGCSLPLGLHHDGDDAWLYFDPVFPETRNPLRIRRRLHPEFIPRIAAELKGERFPVVYTGQHPDEFSRYWQEITGSADFLYSCPLIRSEFLNSRGRLSEYSAIFVSSGRSVPATAGLQSAIWYAPGETTAAALRNLHGDINIVTCGSASGMAAEFIREQINAPVRGPVLWCGAQGGIRDGLEILEGSGWVPEVLATHKTEPVPAGSITSLPACPAIWLFTSPSAVRSYLESGLRDSHHLYASIGPTTSRELMTNNLPVYMEASRPETEYVIAELTGSLPSKSDWQEAFSSWSLL